MDRQAGLPTLNHLLQHTLRSLCTDSQWVYAVFWRILPRHYPPPKWETEGGVVDRSRGNKRNWILVWEDGFCNFPVCSGQAQRAGLGITSSEETSEALNPELFFKMSHEVYNYGEGLMGKVAADNSHKWVYRDPVENGISSFLPPWHGSLDPHPRTWEAQFKAGIQTVAVVAVEEGLLQLGSTAKIVEDLNFVILVQRNFNYLQSIPGVFGPHPSSLTNGSCCKRPVQCGSGDQELYPPPEPGVRGNWIMSPEDHQTRFMSNGYMSPRVAVDPFLMSPRTGVMNGWRSSLRDSDSILGIKRGPPDTDHTTGHFSDFKDFPYSSSLGKMRSSASWRPECPSPPKALNTGRCTSGSSLSFNRIPSMSASLHALLSNLPSVTPEELDFNHGLQQRTDSPPASGGHHATGNSPPTTSSNYAGSPPPANAATSPVQPQADCRTSPIRLRPGALAPRSITSSASDHGSSSPDHPHIANTAPDDQSSDSRPGSCTLNGPAAAAPDHELLSCNNSCNCNGPSAAGELPATLTEAFNTSNIDCSASGCITCPAAAVSAAPILSASVVTADQRFHQHQLIGSAAHVLPDLHRGGILVNPAPIKDHQIATFDNLPGTYFGLHEDALENNVDNYNSIFSEIY